MDLRRGDFVRYPDGSLCVRIFCKVCQGIPISFSISLFFSPWRIRTRILVHWTMSGYTSLILPVSSLSGFGIWTALFNRHLFSNLPLTFPPSFIVGSQVSTASLDPLSCLISGRQLFLRFEIPAKYLEVVLRSIAQPCDGTIRDSG